MRKTGLLFCAATSAAILCLGATAGVATAGSTKAPAANKSIRDTSITIGTAASSAWQAVLYLAEAKGYFAAQHLKVNFLVTSTTSLPTTLVAGDIDLATSGASSALALTTEGKPSTVVMNASSGNSSSALVANASVKSASGCHRLGTLTPGTSVYAYAGWWNNHLKLHADIVSFESLADELAAVTSGSVNCAVADLAIFLPAVQAGEVHFLYDPRKPTTYPKDFPDDIPSGAIWGLSSFVKSHTKAMEGFVVAVREAAQYFEDYKNSSRIASLLRKDYAVWGLETQSALVSLIKASIPFLYVDGGTISQEQWKATLTLSGYGLTTKYTAPEYSYSRIVDMSFEDYAVKEAQATCKASGGRWNTTTSTCKR